MLGSNRSANLDGWLYMNAKSVTVRWPIRLPTGTREGAGIDPLSSGKLFYFRTLGPPQYRFDTHKLPIEQILRWEAARAFCEVSDSWTLGRSHARYFVWRLGATSLALRGDTVAEALTAWI